MTTGVEMPESEKMDAEVTVNAIGAAGWDIQVRYEEGEWRVWLGDDGAIIGEGRTKREAIYDASEALGNMMTMLLTAIQS